MSNGVELIKKLSFGKKIRLSIIALIVGIMVLAPIVAAAKNPNDGIVPVGPEYLGKTYGEWSAEWWTWVLSIPLSKTLSMMMEQDNSLPKHNQEMCGF